MSELNFCPYCDAPQHKVMVCKGELFFCRTCNKFFNLKELEVECPKCDGHSMKTSDFPAPSGEAIFQCTSCKKMVSAKEFFESNKL